jgi:hypothetical protein
MDIFHSNGHFTAMDIFHSLQHRFSGNLICILHIDRIRKIKRLQEQPATAVQHSEKKHEYLKLSSRCFCAPWSEAF